MIEPFYQQLLVLFVTVVIIVGLYLERWKPAVVFIAGIFVLLVLKIVPTQVFLNSFSNKQIISIFLLIFITSAINDNFNLTYWFDRLFSKSSSGQSFLARMTFGVAALSSFMNNTPIVALMIPYIRAWASKKNISASKLLIPLSFAASLGGMITVIGTSTNLVLNGFLDEYNAPVLGFMDFFPLGVLVTVVGCTYLILGAYKLLPARVLPTQGYKENRRQYLVETVVDKESRLVGKSLTTAKLRNLKGVYLAQLVRGDHIIAPVRPEEVIEAGDHLFFAGETELVMDFLQKEEGISLVEQHGFGKGSINVVEAVIPANSSLAGRTVKEYGFREEFDAAIIGIHRNGEKIFGKIGNVLLKNGDLLLMLAGPRFYKSSEKDRNLYVVSNMSPLDDGNPLHKRSFIIIVALVMLLLFFEFFSLFMSLLVILMVLMALNLLPIQQVRKETNIGLFVILACALTLGKAMISTGAADMVAQPFVDFFVPYGRVTLYIGIFLLTLLLTSFITNVAAVSIAFPIVYALVNTMGVDGTPFYMVVAFAASASFLTPISYQTNLMVYGPGSYTFKDFLKVGAPLTVLYAVTVISYLSVVY